MTPTAANEQIPRSLSLLQRIRVAPLHPLSVNWILILVIVGVDAATPAGVGVGILLIVPILISAMRDDRPAVVGLTVFISALGYVLAAVFGVETEVPVSIWLSNRVMVVLGLVVTALIAFLLQRGRLEALAGRDAALSERDLNRLLMSLLAHDLRSPLTVASEGFKYVEESLADGRPIDRVLLTDVRARLRRSLRAIDVVLSLARSELNEADEPGPAKPTLPVRVADELRAEIDSFADEATLRRKALLVELQDIEDRAYLVDGIVLRQAVAILVDNAIRHAVPGTIRISAALPPSMLTVRIADCGPGLSTSRAQAPSAASGSRLGLDLCRSMVSRAGGSLIVERDGEDGTTFAIHLPARPVSEPENGSRGAETVVSVAAPSISR